MVQVKIKKPAAVIFDFSGTAARETFVEKYLLPYFTAAKKAYFEANWSKDECKEDVKALAAAAAKDSDAPKIDTSGGKQDQLNSVAKYVDYCLEKGKVGSKAFIMYRFHVWFDGYERGKLQTPVYSDVAVHIQKWHLTLNIKLFIMSNGWAEATKRFMQKTSHGDLAMLIEDQFDTSLGSLTNAETFKKMIAKVKEDPKDVVFLTKSPEEGKAAKSAGLNVILVLTHSSFERSRHRARDMQGHSHWALFHPN